MTISTESSEVTYLGNDATSTFPFTFPIFAASHLVVTHIASDGTETAQVESTNYTLTWVGPGRTGSVNRIRVVLGIPEAYPLPTGESYRLERTVPLTQQVDLVNNSRVRIDQMEKGLDYVTQIAQQIDRAVDDHEVRIEDLENAPTGGGGGSYGVSVIDYGATGDGTTDDTAAIQSAINAAFSNGGGTVYFPSGVYRANNIMLKSKVLLQGEGVASVIKFTDDAYYSASPYHMDSLIRTASGSTVTDIGVYDLCLDGNYPTVPGDPFYGCPLLHVYYGTTTNRFNVSRVRFQNCGYIGFRAYGVTKETVIKDCTFKDTDAAIWMGGQGGTDVVISGIIAEGGTSEAVMIAMETADIHPPATYSRIIISDVLSYQKTACVRFQGPISRAVVSNCTGWGYTAGTAFHCSLLVDTGITYVPNDISFSNCSAYEFGLGAQLIGNGISFLGGVLYGIDTHGIETSDCEGVTITGVTIRSGNRRSPTVDGYGIRASTNSRDVIVSNNSIISDDDGTWYSGIGAIGTAKHVVITANCIDGWTNGGIVVNGGASLSITNNYGRRGANNNFVLVVDPAPIFELAGNRGGKALDADPDQAGWDIAMSMVNKVVSLVHRDFAQIIWQSGAYEIETINTSSMGRGRTVVIEMRVEATIKHGVGNLICPNGKDIHAYVGDAFTLMAVYSSGWKHYVQRLGSDPKWTTTTEIVSAAGTTAVPESAQTVVVTGTTTHTVTLPAAYDGKSVVVKNRSTGTVTVSRAGTDTIDGGTASLTLLSGDSRSLTANATDWTVVGNNGTATPASHASTHVGGADPIPAATISNDGLMTAAQVAALGYKSSVAGFYDWNDFVGGGNSGTVSTTIYTFSASVGGLSFSNGYVANTIGNARLTTNAGTTAYATLYSSPNMMNMSDGTIEINTSFRLATASDGTETYTCRFGIGDTTTGADPVDGAFFRYTNAVNGGRWQCVTRQNDTETATDSGVTTGIGSATMVKAKIVSTPGVDVKFYLGGALVATNTTNIPSGTARSTGVLAGQIVKSAGTTAREMTLDYVEVIVSLTTPR